MSAIDEVIARVSGLSPEDRVYLGREAYVDMCEALKEMNFNRNYVNLYVQLTVRAFVSADKVCDVMEKDIFNAITGSGFSFEEFAEYSDYGSGAEFVEKYDELVDSGTDKLKTSTCIFGLCIMANDGVVTEAERALLEKVLA